MLQPIKRLQRLSRAAFVVMAGCTIPYPTIHGVEQVRAADPPTTRTWTCGAQQIGLIQNSGGKPELLVHTDFSGVWRMSNAWREGSDLHFFGWTGEFASTARYTTQSTGGVEYVIPLDAGKDGLRRRYARTRGHSVTSSTGVSGAT